MRNATDAGLKVSADKTNKTVTITLPFKSDPKPSSSGKTVIVAGTDGAVETELVVNGKRVVANLNLYIYAKDKGAGAAPATVGE